jgi:methylated-DNA--[protein]-cysteine S-methyltransferase
MKTMQEAVDYGLSFDDVYVDEPFGRDKGIWKLIRYKENKKAFMFIHEREGNTWINLKVQPEVRDFWKRTYKAVKPAYHQNKEHWISVVLDGTIPIKDIHRMIGESYDLVADSPTKRIYEAVKKIPRGKVATYKRVAELAGNPKMCRAVGNALHKNPNPDIIPCYRVVNSKGELSGEFAFGGAGKQQELLENDGIEVVNGRVNLERYGF